MKAEEFLHDYKNGIGMRLISDMSPEQVAAYAIEFARYHVHKALQAACDGSNLRGESVHRSLPDLIEDSVYVHDPYGPDYIYRPNILSILNAYPDENIQ